MAVNIFEPVDAHSNVESRTSYFLTPPKRGFWPIHWSGVTTCGDKSNNFLMLHSLPYLGDSSAAGSNFRRIDEYPPYWCQKSFSPHLLRSRHALAG